LNRPQIVTRAGEHEVIFSEFSQWAEPLKDSFTEVLSENLSRLIPTDRVVVYPWSARTELDLKVEVEVIRFTGQSDGVVTLAARWRLLQGNGSEVLPMRLSRYEEPIGAGSTEALIAAMSRALTRSHRSPGQRVRSCHPSLGSTRLSASPTLSFACSQSSGSASNSAALRPPDPKRRSG
jgi:uncharacterized lipoprotein YmbA